MNKSKVFLAIGMLIFGGCAVFIRKPDKSVTSGNGKDWPTYGGNYAGNRYSSLDQINIDNVKDLQLAWTYNVFEEINTKGVRPMEIQHQPIVVDGILYGSTGKLKLFAVKAGTGEEIWKFDPFADGQARYRPNRGVTYWSDGDDKRILYVAGPHLYSINAKNGQLIQSFGVNGKVDLHAGLGNDRFDIQDLAITSTTPGVIYKNVYVTGSTVSEDGDALPGHIRGFDVRSGKLLWTFNTIPQPGEFGYDTWPQDAYKKIGGANNWAGMVLDEKRGVVYMGTGSPSVDFYGGDRKGANLFGNCIIALDAQTGKLKWYYQTVHHDLWDYDIPCTPNLSTVKHNGKMVDVVVQTTKDGLVYVLDRDSGESLFAVEEVPVPPSNVPGEHAWPTQKKPVKPLPFNRQVYTNEDIPNKEIFPESHAYVSEILKNTQYGTKFTPPSVNGTLGFGISGGAEWGGNATDPKGVLYQNVSEMPYIVKLTDMASKVKNSTSKGNTLYLNNCASCHGVDRKEGEGGNEGNKIPDLISIGSKMSRIMISEVLKSGRGRMPSFQHVSETDRNAIVDFLLGIEDQSKKQEGKSVLKKDKDFPYIPPYTRSGGGRFTDKSGYPAISPPWGTLNAIDLNTGEYLWRVPLGEYPELTKKGIPLTGTENAGGPVVTAGGLVFIAATADERIRAFNSRTGETVWEYQLPAGAFATPISYEVGGKQYIAIAVGGTRGGRKQGGWYMAFSLK